jgi:hypothetical protein
VSEIERLGDVLEGVDAGIYAYGLVAARLDGDERDEALSDMASLRAERDRLRARITALGGTPPAAAAAYTPPFDVDDRASARRLAALVEDRLAGQLAALAAASTDGARARAAAVAAQRAVRVVAWSGTAPTWNGAG